MTVCFQCRLVPNVGLEDESPSSKSEASQEEENADTETANTQTDVSPINQTDITDAQRSPHHQFANGERRRRKLPEIPKTRKCKYDPIIKILI